VGIKGSWKRPRSITREEEELRWEYLEGRIGYSTYKKRYAELLHQGKIQRSGRVLQP